MGEQLIASLALLIIYIIGGVLQLRSSRRTKRRIVDNTSDIVAANQRREALEALVTDQKVIIDDLREQVAKLSHVQILYETLSESHRLLQNEHRNLSNTVETLRKETAKLREALEQEIKSKEELMAALEAERTQRHDAVLENQILHQILKDLRVQYTEVTDKQNEEPGDNQTSGAEKKVSRRTRSQSQAL